MPTTVIGMFGTIAGGTENSIATIDIPEDGMITGIDWDARCNMDADNEAFTCELSFIATIQETSNDVRGRLSSISVNTAILSSVGDVTPVMQKWIGPMALQVSGGERLHLHAASTTGVTGQVRCNVHLDLDRPTRRRSRRR